MFLGLLFIFLYANIRIIYNIIYANKYSGPSRCTLSHIWHQKVLFTITRGPYKLINEKA